MRRLRVCFQIDINSREEYPFAIWRDRRFLHTLQLHHVFEGEGMFSLSGSNQSRKEAKDKSTRAHEGLQQ
jgi:hypothetical protein